MGSQSFVLEKKKKKKKLFLTKIQSSFTGATAQNCNFETGLCNYKQDQSDKFDWRWFHGRTRSRGTGPTSDHTPKSKTSEY